MTKTQQTEPGSPTSMVALTRRSLAGAILGAGVLAAGPRTAWAAEKATYLLPAPPFLPAFSPFQIAQKQGYYAAEGVELTFQAGRGGADVAKQVGLGNAEIGGGVGDTSMIVRAQGLPVRAVALLGHRPIFQVAIRKAAGIRDIAGLKGKKIGVIAFQDTSFYALLGTLAALGLKRNDVQIQAVGAAGMTQLMISGDLDAIMATPEWGITIEDANVPLDYHPIDQLFPAMAQAILTSDKLISERPALVRGVVRGTLKAIRDVIADPAAATRVYVSAVPQHAGKEAEIERILRRYAEQVYATPRPEDLGRFDAERIRTVQKFYMENGIIQTAVPVPELYTNEFVG
ncbi:ABC transporter substrate-binding protein [Roseomonas sp. OT10]|uniref:ABC transporter substrate-binding protein n=1 Tax=Roseomonas cutis TaxID=2897332 RepID=UPI001E2CE017|nr:ABC transporter substrate-binding protein [Roseomonas sp. OT10]UFN48174.1 ABC transporter substrate-binding protein [Roseomonas sp. OT10]